VFVVGVNNDSVHLNNDIITSSGGGAVTAFNVERAPLVSTPAAGQLVLGATIDVSVFIGNADSGSNGDGTTNGFFSGGHAVEVTCLPVVTTTVPPGSTTTGPPVTVPPGSTTTGPPVTVPPGSTTTTTNPNVTNTSQPSGGSGSSGGDGTSGSGGGGSNSDTASGGLPVTGSGNTVAMLLAALALIAGGFLLLRSTRTPDAPTDD
jgi:LPXTG-motif cell wall-anchored protein